MAENKQETILLVADRRSTYTARLLQREGYGVVTTYTVDHAVAMCVNRQYAAVVLDQDLFIEVDGWNVAQSIKLVRPGVCVILVLRGVPLRGKPPKGVDGRISQQNLSKLPELIAELHKPLHQSA